MAASCVVRLDRVDGNLHDARLSPAHGFLVRSELLSLSLDAEKQSSRHQQTVMDKVAEISR